MEKFEEIFFRGKKFFLEKKTQFYIFVVGFLILFSNFMFFVVKNSIHMPFWDEWDISHEIMEESDWTKIFLHQHNEHRIGTGLTLAKALAVFTDWNQLYEVKIVSLEILLSCLFLIILVKKLKRRLLASDLFIPFIFLNTVQVGNILFPFQLTFVFPLFFFCAGLLALTFENKKIRNFLLVICSLFAAYSSLHGLLVVAVFLAFLILEIVQKKGEGLKLFILTALAQILVIASYFVGLKSNPQAELNLNLGGRTFDFASVFTGGGFFLMDSSGVLKPLQYLIFASLLFFLAWSFWVSWKSKKFSLAHVSFLLLLLYVFLFAVAITVGRANLGLAQALETRYLTFTMLLPIGIWLLIADSAKGKYLKVLLFAFLFVNIFYFSDRYHKMAQGTSRIKEAWTCYQTENKKDWQKCFEISPLYPDRTRLETLLPEVLKFKKLR